MDEGGDEIRGSCACASSNEGGNEQDASSQISCKYQRPPQFNEVTPCLPV